MFLLVVSCGGSRKTLRRPHVEPVSALPRLVTSLARNAMDRICFLVNHDQVHQVAHSLPIAMAMAERHLARITVAVTTPETEQHVLRLAGPAAKRFEIVRLGLRSPLSKHLDAALGKLVPTRKLLVYRDNLDFFRRFDALVVSEKTSLLLKTRYGLDRLRIIHTRHGAGDRAIGFGKESALFDLVLVAGPKIARRLMHEAGVSPERIRVVGYSKFDLCAENRIAPPFPDSTKPIVLYNPHPSPRLSSWYRAGEALLETFRNSGRYNLIFAPHVMMFARPWTVTISPPAIRRMRKPDLRFRDASNMLIDLGSPASTDMSYTNLADVYVGDVSSQVYEFLHRPRPCLHLNVHDLNWQGNPDYAHWQAGPVVGPGDDIVAAVDRAIETHASYEPVQRMLLEDTFSITAKPASVMAADAIAEFLGSGPER
jgi:hypothetical protein